MRLLRRSDVGEYSLTKDLVGDDIIPPYAILSHTWRENTEVTFEDLKNGASKEKLGYEKIRFCGEQASKVGLQHFWVDTCCIDKSNHVEFSEAINSMYRWYQNATICYVYLSDISTATQTENHESNNDSFGSTCVQSFLDSRWFTRGWTLQELLAPRSVEFFSREGEFLGNKKTLEQRIHQVTGIATQALQGTPLGEFSIADRFLWAESRRTTRREDKAYSLLGIFGVYMPLIYGEGEDNAFRRLKEEINKLSSGPRREQRTNPLSIVGSSTDIIQSINTTSMSISSFIRSVRESRPDLDTVDSELQSIKRTLELLREDLDTESGDKVPLSLPSSLEEQILGIMNCCATTIKHVNEFVGKYRDRLAKLQAGQIRWATDGKLDIQRCRSVLESNRRALEIAVDLLAWSMTREVTRDPTAFENDPSHTKKDTAEILEEIARLQEQLPQDLTQSGSGREFLMDKYLENLSSYTETLDIDIDANWDAETDWTDDADDSSFVMVFESVVKHSDGHPSSMEACASTLKILKRIGFTEQYSRLPKSFVLAVQNRMSKSQILQPRLLSFGFWNRAPIFVMGTFIFPGTLRAITESMSLREIAQNMTPAVLRGYQRRSVLDRPWPALVPSSNPDVEVVGMLIFGMNASDREEMQAFQSGMFELSRVTVEIVLADGKKEFQEALAYVWEGPLALIVPIEDMSWSPLDMLRDEWLSDILESVQNEELAL